MPRFSFLLIVCFVFTSCASDRNTTPITAKKTERNTLIVIEEDIPFNENMLNWRYKANSLISFSNGMEEKQKAYDALGKYPNPSEIGEAITVKTIQNNSSLIQETITKSFKRKTKPSSLKTIASDERATLYILDYSLNSWDLKPHPENKSKFYLDMDMSMRLYDVEKETVLVREKCYFAEKGKPYSQYELFNEDAKILKNSITQKAKECAQQVNKSLEEEFKTTKS